MPARLAMLVLFVACSSDAPLLIERGGLADVAGDASIEFDAELGVLDPIEPESDQNALGELPQADTSGPDAKDQGIDSPVVPATVRLVTNGEYLPLLKDALIKAKFSIQVVTLEFCKGYLTDEVMSLLKAAVSRGVNVQVLLDNNPEDNAGRVAELKAAGAQARLDSNERTLHTKLVVVDRTWAMVGSTNLSVAGLKYNNEANLLFTDPEIAGELAEYADALWASDSGPKKLPDKPVSDVTLMGDGQYFDSVLPVIFAAQEKVRLVMYNLDVSAAKARDLGKALTEAANRGVSVMVVLELSNFADDVNSDNKAARQFLLAGGVDVRLDPIGTTTHAKLLVVDETVVVYSGNWTYSSLERNHEAGAIVTDGTIAAEAAQFFDEIWAVSN